MSKERDRAPLVTEASPLATRVAAHTSGRCESEGPYEDVVQGFTAGPETARSDERPAIGQLLSGRYRIQRELGQGGMGVVYLATDEQVAGETFAIKLLKEGLDPQALEWLREEVRKTRRLSHPNIVDAHSVNVDGRKLYVLMEHLEGKSLDALLNEEFGRGMPFSHAWPIIEDAGAALAHAHDHNVIHRDLKPANIFVTTSGRTKLLDFGIARVSRGPLRQHHSQSLVLTPAYASCEMLEEKDADPRDDIYSFACVIYEILCGKRPFGELTALEAREAGTRVLPLQGLSRGQNAALARALAFDRDARTGTVETLVAGIADTKPRARLGTLLAAVSFITITVAGLTYFALDRLGVSRHPSTVVAVTSNAQQGASLAAAPTTPNAPDLPLHSIAVLPFVNMSSDKEQDYFSDGLTEEMINLLGQVPDLHVPARTSSFYFKGKNEPIANMARQLKVLHVLEGSVRKSGKRLRITAQLILADNGYHVWSQTYDRDDTDVFGVQEDIAKAVVSALQVKLGAGVQETGSRTTTNTEAYNQYLLGRQLDRRDSLEGFRGAIHAYREAIALDPRYAAAYAGLALSEATVADLTGDASGIGRAGDHADKAIALAPSDATGYAARGYLRTVLLWDWSGAQADIEKALSLDPRKSDVLGRYARLLAVTGRLPQAIAAQKQATELDPLASSAWEGLGFYYLGIGDYPAAETALGRAIEIQPTSVMALSDLGKTRLLEGKGHEALKAFRKIDEEEFRLMGIAMAEHTLRHAKESQQALETLMAKHAREAAYQVAEACAWRGDNDCAFQWLERAYRQRDGGLSEIKIAPMLRSSHADPRFKTLLRKLKLPE